MINFIKKLRNKFKKHNIDGYVVPKNDDYFTEYSKINRLKIFQISVVQLELRNIKKQKLFIYRWKVHHTKSARKWKKF